MKTYVDKRVLIWLASWVNILDSLVYIFPSTYLKSHFYLSILKLIIKLEKP